MKILLLGAARHQVPAIEAAVGAGLRVFTADNRPANPGHALAEKSFAVSAADPEAVTALAQELAVDGILGFASEVCARTAAFAAGKLGLPGPEFSAVESLSRKDLFRQMLADSRLQACRWRSFAAGDAGLAGRFACELPNGCVVKPADNSGGRGVSIRPPPDRFAAAFAAAMDATWQKKVVVEEFIARTGSQCGGDGWMEEGRLKFLHCYDNDTLPSPNDGAAVRETFPSAHSADQLAALRGRLESMLQAAGYDRGPFNFDACFTADGSPFVFEIAPRNGGNFIPLTIHRQTGVDLTHAAVLASVDRQFRLPIPMAAEPERPRFHANWVIHSQKAGIFRAVNLSAALRPHVLDCILYQQPGAPVNSFRTSGDMLGILLMEFGSRQEMLSTMDRVPDLCTVEVSSP